MLRRLRELFLVGFLPLVMAGTAPAASPPPASEEAAYVEICSGLPDSWLLDAFDKSSAAQRRWSERLEWVDGEKLRQTAAVVKSLEDLGAPAPSRLEPDCFGSEPCRAVQLIESLRPLFSRLQFQKAVLSLAPLCQALEAYDVVITQQLSNPQLDPRDRIALLMLRGQALRSMSFMKRSALPDDPKIERLAEIIVELATIDADLKGAAFIEGALGAETPARLIGDPADLKHGAFLLVQHADQNPRLQFLVLKSLEREDLQRLGLARQYAYLYDRVHLRLYGDQRFGTQLRCVKGEAVLEGATAGPELNAARAQYGLEPFDDYLRIVAPSCRG